MDVCEKCGNMPVHECWFVNKVVNSFVASFCLDDSQNRVNGYNKYSDVNGSKFSCKLSKDSGFGISQDSNQYIIWKHCFDTTLAKSSVKITTTKTKIEIHVAYCIPIQVGKLHPWFFKT